LLGTLRLSKTVSAVGIQLRIEDTKFLVVAAVSPERSHNCYNKKFCVLYS